MGSRIPPNERPRRGCIRCEFCGRAVPSTAALHSHQASLHSQALKDKAKHKAIAVKSSQVQKPEQRKVVVKKVKAKTTEVDNKETPKPLSPDQSSSSETETDIPKVGTTKPKQDNIKENLEKTPTKPLVQTKSSKMNVQKKTTATLRAPVKSVRKFEYKCPKCDKRYPVLFFAQKHIQKHHCVNSNNEKVPENSPQIIRPIFMELCVYCNKCCPKPHDCPNRPDLSLMTYDCIGCKQKFNEEALYHEHIPTVHAEGSYTMFFPVESEFMKWKSQMEHQTKCEYLLMGKYGPKEIYQCSEYTDNFTENSTLNCPSSIISTKSKSQKGFQVQFYPCHFKHDYKVYKLIKSAHADGSFDETDMYLQFKSLMETIIQEAAKININNLKCLMSRANEMMSVLQEYDEDKELDTTVNQPAITLKKSNVSKAVDDVTVRSSTRSRKRVIQENGTGEKRMRESSGDTNIHVKASAKKADKFSLADDKDSDKILKELDKGNEKAIDTCNQSPSFNDTYKDFIKNNVLNVPKKKNIVKTKMGQFKGLSPKKVVKKNSIGGQSKAKDIQYEIKEQENDCNILILKI